MAITFTTPSELTTAETVTNTAALVVDDGTNVQKATPKQIVDAGRPVASESQAIDGTDNETTMTPLTVKQAIDADTSGAVAQAQAWAESPTPPDPDDATSKSAKTWAGVSEGFAGVAETAAANAALFDGPKFDSIAEMAAWDGFEDLDFAVVQSGFNGEPETFRYDASSTLTADGALIVDAVGMGVGRLVSTRTVYATWAEFIGDRRTFEAGSTLRVIGVPDVYVATDGSGIPFLDNAGGQSFDLTPGFMGWSLQAFGAGLGAANDSPAIQAAVNVAYASSKFRTIKAGMGQYNIATTISCPSSGLNIEGSGMTSTQFIVKTNTGIGFDFGDNINPVEKIHLSKFSIRGEGDLDNNTSLIRTRFCQKTVSIVQVEFNFSAATGLDMVKSWGTRIEDCHFYFVNRGARLEDFNDGVISSCYFWNQNADNLVLVNGTSSTIFGNAFESWGLSNPSAFTNINLVNHKNCNFYGNWIETAQASDSAFVSDGTATGLRFENNVVFGNNCVDHLVVVGGASSYVGRNRLAISNGARSHISLLAPATRTRIEENELVGSSGLISDFTGGQYFGDQPLDIRATQTIDVNLVDDAVATSQFTVTGAEVGDFVEVSASTNMLDVVVHAYVVATDTVRLNALNISGTTRNLGSVIFRIKVTKK